MTRRTIDINSHTYLRDGGDGVVADSAYYDAGHIRAILSAAIWQIFAQATRDGAVEIAEPVIAGLAVTAEEIRQAGRSGQALALEKIQASAATLIRAALQSVDLHISTDRIVRGDADYIRPRSREEGTYLYTADLPVRGEEDWPIIEALNHAVTTIDKRADGHPC